VVTYTQLAERNVSFQLLRTNPKLTTNIKLTVDSAGDLWLNSINANEQLADQKYKRFAINENSSHEVNLYKFYDSGKTPSSIAYQVGSTIGKSAVAKDLKDQFDFDLYTSGAKYLTSRQYSEKFAYFAPLYLDQVVPTKFVIFKIPGASNYTAGQGKTLQNISVQDFATDAFKHATIVKVFDLGKTSKIGQYLENMAKNPMFTKKPLYVNHKLDGYSLYRGASISSGTYVEIPEQLSTVFSRSLPLLKVEEFVTLGYERNKIVYPKILNMEFLFDDDTSNTYEFNRYFGFYCNDIDLEEFEIDLDRMYSESAENVVAVETVDQLSLSPSSTFTVLVTGTNLDDLGINEVSFSGSGDISVTGVVFSGGVLTLSGTYTSFPIGTQLTITANKTNPITFELQSSTISDPWIELETLSVDPLVNDQTLPVRYNQSDDISFILTNSTGVKFNGKAINQNLSDINHNRTSTETLFFPYIKSKTGDLHLINSNDWNQNDTVVTFKIDDVSIDLGTFFGPTELVSQPTASISNTDTKSTVSLQFLNKPNHLDRLRLYHPSGSCLDVNDNGGRYDEIVFVKSYFSGGPSSLPSGTAYVVDYPAIPTINFSALDPNSVPPSNTQYSPATIGTQYISTINNSKWYFNGTEYVEGIYGSRIYVNADLDISQITQAIYNVAIELRDSSILAVPFNDTVFIQSREFGDTYGEVKIRVIAASSSTFKINGESTNSLVWADGGFLSKPHAIIDIGNIQKLTPLLDDIVVKTNTNWSKISRVCRAVDLIKNGLSDLDQEAAISYFNSYATLELVDDEVVNVNYDKIEIRKLFKPKIGVLSMFEVMDIDFSTYSTRYSRNLLLDLYKDIYIPPNVTMLDFTKYSYQIVGDGDIEVNGQLYDVASVGSGTRPLVWQNTDQLSKYTIVRGDAVLIYGKKRPNTTTDPTSTSYPDRLDLAYYDESRDLIDFSGPFALKADHAYQSQQRLTYENRDRYVLGNVSSEYHVYLENFNKEYASTGRVIPYITKWGLEDSTDSRDNPYRLNSDLMFGKDNFGPSQRETSPTPEKLTHEWFYIESEFGYLNDPKLSRYNFSYFDSPLDISQLTTSSQYFETYFTYIPKVGELEVDRPQFRYSTLNKNQFTQQYETTFKGAKFRFYEIDDFGNSIVDTTRFEDYKFSIIVKPIKEVPTVTRQPIKYRVIENTNAKAITVLIEVAIGHKGLLDQAILNRDWSTLTGDTINQSTVFSNSFRSTQSRYSIDTTIIVSSLTTYLDLINGTTLIPADLGKTVHIVYAPVISPSSSPIALYSSIISSAGTSVYADVTNGIISNGDRLGERAYTSVTQAIPLILNQGTYPCVRIQSEFQDAWALNTASAGSGQLDPSSGVFNNTLNGGTLAINQISSSSSPFFTNGSIDQSYKLNQLLQSGNEFKIAFGIPNSSYSDVIYSVSSATTYSSGIFTIPITYVSGGITASISNGTHVLFKSNWVIPSPSDSNSSALDEFIIEHNIAYYESTVGDYRIEFSDVSNLTHSFLYFAKNKKYNNKAAAYSTIKLSRGVDLSTSGVNISATTLLPESIETRKLVGLIDYDSAADSEIEQSNIGFSPFYIIKPGQKNILLQIENVSGPSSIPVLPTPTNLSNITLTEDGIAGANQNLVILTQSSTKSLKTIIPTTINLGDVISFSYAEVGVPNGTTSTWVEQTQHFQIFGGVKYFEKLFGNLSFAKFVQLLDKSQEVISWETYTDGINLNAKKLSMEVLAADEISKSTIVKISQESVQSGQINQIAGVTLSEVNSQAYSVNRYSGEYDIITRPIAGFKYNFTINENDLTSANVCLNPNVENFFILPEFEFVKYSKTSILDLENSQNYSAEYPLIDETPIDRTSLNVLSSSWDYNYHFEYSQKNSFSRIPGSRRVTEDYSFVSKLINVPSGFTIESFTSLEVNNANFLTSTATNANLEYSIFGNELRFKFNITDLITKHLSDNGLRAEFQKFFKDDAGNQISKSIEFLGDLTFEQYLAQYCSTNLIKLYSIDSFEFYSLNDSTIPNNLINFIQLDYDLLGDLGYLLVRNVKINNTKSNLVEGSILIKPNTGIKLVPKIKIKFI
jgi:hypothetical protein